MQYSMEATSLLIAVWFGHSELLHNPAMYNIGYISTNQAAVVYMVQKIK